LVEGHESIIWPLAVYFGAVLLLVVFMLISSHFLGQRHMERGTAEPYESGIRPTSSAWIRFDVKYFMVAMFFVIFDVEIIFVYAWATAVREVGWPGFVEMVLFIGVLSVALVYLWRNGALDWGVRKTRSGLR
jgi:NADH-quinone oxidoreductase subunit A